MREPFELYTFFCVCWACLLASRRLPLFYSNKVPIDFYFFFFNPEVWWSKSSIGRTPLPRLPLKKHIEKKSMGGVPVDNRFQWHKEATSFSWFFFQIKLKTLENDQSIVIRLSISYTWSALSTFELRRSWFRSSRVQFKILGRRSSWLGNLERPIDWYWLYTKKKYKSVKKKRFPRTVVHHSTAFKWVYYQTIEVDCVYTDRGCIDPPQLPWKE